MKTGADEKDGTDGKGLRAGAACLEITPERDGLWLAGHGKSRRSEGIRDPLYVRTLFLSLGDVSVSLSCLDLIGLRKVHVDQIRSRLKGIVPAERVLIFTTHTHSGPDTIGYWGKRVLKRFPLKSGVDPEYMERVQAQTVACIEKAAQEAVPVRAFATCASAPAHWTRNVRREGFKEDNISILQFRNDHDESVAVLSNYPCHPEALGRDNLQVSADFLSDLHKVVEARTGGVSLFLQQALGGVVPGTSGESSIEFLGNSLGELIVSALEKDPEPLSPDVGLRFVRREFEVPVDNRKIMFAARRGLMPATSEEVGSGKLRTETSLLEFWPLRMVTVPGEALPELGFHIQAILNCPYPFVFSVGCDELGYILPRSHAKNRSYGYERSMSVSPGLSDILLEQIRQMVWKAG